MTALSDSEARQAARLNVVSKFLGQISGELNGSLFGGRAGSCCPHYFANPCTTQTSGRFRQKLIATERTTKDADRSGTPSGAATALVQGTPTVDTPSGKLDFELFLPTKETVTKLYDEMDYQRACQLYLWAMNGVAS